MKTYQHWVVWNENFRPNPQAKVQLGGLWKLKELRPAPRPALEELASVWLVVHPRGLINTRKKNQRSQKL